MWMFWTHEAKLFCLVKSVFVLSMLFEATVFVFFLQRVNKLIIDVSPSVYTVQPSCEKG